MPKNWKMYILAFGIGIACSVAVFELVIVPHAVSGLGRELAAAKSSLVDSKTQYRQLAAGNDQLQQTVTERDRLVKQQSDTIKTLSDQIAQGQLATSGLEQTVATAGGDIESRIRAIADGFDKLYDIYNPSTIGPRRN